MPHNSAQRGAAVRCSLSEPRMICSAPGGTSDATIGRELASEVILKTDCTGSSEGELRGGGSTFSRELDSGSLMHSHGSELGSDDIEAMLGDIVEAAQRGFPTFRVPIDVFVAYLWERLPAGVPRRAGLRQMHTSDLYLACGCAR